MDPIEERIRKKIISELITIKFLARHLGYKLSSFYRMLKGPDYKLSFLQEVAKALGVSVAYLIGETSQERFPKPYEELNPAYHGKEELRKQLKQMLLEMMTETLDAYPPIKSNKTDEEQ